MKKILSILGLACMLASCDDLFEPAIENNLGRDYMYVNPEYAEAILANAYTRIPCGSYSFNDVAVDDAVSNEASNSYRKMAAGTWTSETNPTDRWQSCRAAIQYINIFLQNAEQVHWADEELMSKMFCDRLMGEAYAMRAMYTYYLLEAHGGYADGELLGIPLLYEPEEQGSDFNKPRDTFADCIKSIEADVKKACELLPTDYGDAAVTQMMARYGAGSSQTNRVFGSIFMGRISGRIAQTFLSKAYILAASPAFNQGSGVNWETAANQSAKVLGYVGGISGIDPTGWTWYCNKEQLEALTDGECPKEVLWRGEKSQSNDIESDNYPPTLWGKGRINPSQNLVDAFPMANGYPITDSNSGYNAQNPYADRDPRLATYITYNGMTCSVTNGTVNTAADGTTNDALNMLVGQSTRTGYYLRKLLRQDLTLNPNSSSKQYHYTARIRYTEIFLDYAEAANEAWGPTGTGSNGFSAYDVVKAIRARAGVGANNGDAYLESIKGDKDKMREMIRNERRLELCFEGRRFWDLRRWKAEMNTTVKGMSISGGVYNVIDVETRNYKDYQYYGPIPYSEVLKFSNLKQNQGW